MVLQSGCLDCLLRLKTNRVQLLDAVECLMVAINHCAAQAVFLAWEAWGRLACCKTLASTKPEDKKPQNRGYEGADSKGERRHEHSAPFACAIRAERAAESAHSLF